MHHFYKIGAHNDVYTGNMGWSYSKTLICRGRYRTIYWMINPRAWRTRSIFSEWLWTYGSNWHKLAELIASRRYLYTREINRSQIAEYQALQLRWDSLTIFVCANTKRWRTVNSQNEMHKKICCEYFWTESFRIPDIAQLLERLSNCDLLRSHDMAVDVFTLLHIYAIWYHSHYKIMPVFSSASP